MTYQLDALRQHSMVVADTGDLAAIQRYQPHDATTNPSLLLKAFELPGYQALIDQELAAVKADTRDQQAEHAVDRLAVAMGSEIAKLIPGRVSTEVAAKLSFDTEASIRKAHELVALYEKRGVAKDRILIKLASTWEGIRAAEVLEKEGINCNLTLLFSDAQTQACFDAGVFLVSPFVGRVTDWYKKETGQTSPRKRPRRTVRAWRLRAGQSRRLRYRGDGRELPHRRPGASTRRLPTVDHLAGIARRAGDDIGRSEAQCAFDTQWRPTANTSQRACFSLGTQSGRDGQ